MEKSSNTNPDILTAKIAADMSTAKELHEMFYKRVRSTAFSSTNPHVMVRFKLFSNIVSRSGVVGASSKYSEIVSKALAAISFNTIEGKRKLAEVDYMFIDDDKRCIAVLRNGMDMFVLNPETDEPLVVDTIEDLTVSTYMMKSYYLAHITDFPYLNKLTEIIDFRFSRAQVSNDISSVADFCVENDWILENLMNCLEDLKRLVDNSSFVIK